MDHSLLLNWQNKDLTFKEYNVNFLKYWELNGEGAFLLQIREA